MSVYHSIVSLLLASSIYVLPCSGFVDWIYPIHNKTGLVCNYIDTVYFTWTSNITDPYMNLWCTPSGSTVQCSTYGKYWTTNSRTNITTPTRKTQR